MGEILIACLHDATEIEGFEEDGELVKAYIPATKYDQTFFERYTFPANIKYTLSVVENRNWNAIWEGGFEPVIIDDFVSVRADFHKAIEGISYEIIITPKMSFDTGHHATTSLMLESLRVYECAGKKLADFGTGTGILAILACKMKAAEILAIDCDDWSITNARENIEKNKCAGIRLMQADRFPAEAQWDIILANINLHVILANMQYFHHSLNNNGLLIISGILQEDKEKVQSLAADIFLVTDSVRQKNNWICITFKKEVAAEGRG